MVIESERAAMHMQWLITQIAHLKAMAPKAPLVREVEAPSERAVYNIDMGVADLFIAVQDCTTTDDAVKLSQLIQPLMLKLEAAEQAARLRADELAGAQ